MHLVGVSDEPGQLELVIGYPDGRAPGAMNQDRK